MDSDETIQPEARRNAVLASLSSAELASFAPRFRRIEAVRDMEFLAGGQPLREVFFPLRGLLSMVATLRSGHSVEVGTFTRTGVAGAPYYRGAMHLPYGVSSQIPGPVIGMNVDDFHQASETLPHFREAVARSTRGLLAMMAQSTACNASHEVGQRLARWLLASRDAAESDDITLTQEFLAMMIGVQRPTVTLAAGQLQTAGIISYRRGHIRILDVLALEQRACECYAIVRAEMTRSLGNGNVTDHTDT